MAKAAKQEADAARLEVESMQLESAEEAAKLALEGQLEIARQRFVRVMVDTSNLRILYLAYEFFERTGDLASAEDAINRYLVLSGPDEQSSDTAKAYGNLGNIYQT